MSDTDPSLALTVQPLPSMLRLTWANINIDQAAASLRTGCWAPAVQSPAPLSPRCHSIIHRVKAPMLNINYSAGRDSFD